MGNVIRGKACSRHLIEKREEGLVVVSINQSDISFFCQSSSSGKAAETGAKYHYCRSLHWLSLDFLNSQYAE
jgi:hypothetical protein